ncbi:hypothetical protein AB1Y20_015699 [Prymnesium parvum]|uniref:CS domain-containing protein n=1 Tax=Prymnesium parvum TaxID=97485 RepID=A0AB34K280_PRYPA
MPLYTWFQDNTSLTLNVELPPATLPTDLKLILSTRRITLQHTADNSIFLRRRTYAAIEPRCTNCYTMPPPATSASPPTLRVVLYKVIPAGWLCLFSGDPPGQGFLRSPAPMAHALARLAAQARARALAAEDARRVAEGSLAHRRERRAQQSWRARGRMAGPLVKKAGGRVVPSRVGGAVMPAGAQRCEEETRGVVAHGWRPHRRCVASAPAAEGGGGGGTDGEGVETGGGEPRDGGEGSSSESSDEAEEEAFDANGEAEYPLPGSEAACDACAACTHRYWHCVQCGVADGYDLCTSCYAEGTHHEAHTRRHPTHTLRLVTQFTAPLVQKKPALLKAPPAPPPPVAPKGVVSERVHVPKEARVKHSWTQLQGEVYLTVELPQGVRASDLIVVIEPFRLSISLKGVGVILRGSFHKAVRHRDSFWTIEEGQLKILLTKSDPQSWKKLFPEDQELHPMQAIKQICEDPDPPEHSYMDLGPEGRSLVDLHRSYRHAKATGDEGYAAELEEEMKMMRFNWAKDA